MCGKQSEHSARPPSLSSYPRGSNGSPTGCRSTQPLILKMRVLNLDFRDIEASILHFVDLSKRFEVGLCFTATGIDTNANGRRVASEKCESHFFELQTHWPEAQQRRSLNFAYPPTLAVISYPVFSQSTKQLWSIATAWLGRSKLLCISRRSRSVELTISLSLSLSLYSAIEQK